jgi:hypothetical protein
MLAPSGTLADVAPSLLKLMGLGVPTQMSGRALLLEALPTRPGALSDKEPMAAAG